MPVRGTAVPQKMELDMPTHYVKVRDGVKLLICILVCMAYLLLGSAPANGHCGGNNKRSRRKMSLARIKHSSSPNGYGYGIRHPRSTTSPDHHSYGPFSDPCRKQEEDDFNEQQNGFDVFAAPCTFLHLHLIVRRCPLCLFVGGIFDPKETRGSVDLAEICLLNCLLN